MKNFLNNLSIRARMSLSVLLFLMTLGFAMYSAVVAIGANIDFAQQEKYGDQYQRPLGIILHAAGKIRVELAKNTIDHADAAILKSESEKIAAAMVQLKKEQDTVGEILQFTDEGLSSRKRENLKYETVLAKWSSIEDLLKGQDTAKTKETLVSFIADVRGMIAHSGDTSNLILDPDLDSYYLMDATLLALPQALDRLAVIGDEIYPLLAESHELTLSDRTRIAVLNNALQESDMTRLAGDMDTALKEDANFYELNSHFQTKGPAWIAAYKEKNDALVALLTKMADGEKASATQFASTVDAAQNATYTFLNEGYDQLDELLSVRIAFYKGQQVHSMLVSLGGIAISLAFFMFVVGTLTGPLAELTQSMRRLAANDLEAPISYTEAHSEIGQIARSIQKFKETEIQVVSMREDQMAQAVKVEEDRRTLMRELATSFQSTVGSIVQAVAAASTQLQSSAESLTQSSRQTNERAEHVVQTSDQSSMSVSLVASAAEELTSSIGEISRQVEDSTKMINGAVVKIRETNETVQSLADSSTKIGEVVNMINDIASQTNLLALNATIEAARAGEAGKGFAVVAGEVKHLAGQTAKATEEISSSIATMQNVTESAVQAMKEIAKIVENINDVSNTITMAVSQQSSATQDIARNIQSVSSNTSEVTSDIHNVTNAAQESMRESDEVLGAANELSRQSEKLSLEVSQFIEHVKRA